MTFTITDKVQAICTPTSSLGRRRQIIASKSSLPSRRTPQPKNPPTRQLSRRHLLRRRRPPLLRTNPHHKLARPRSPRPRRRRIPPKRLQRQFTPNRRSRRQQLLRRHPIRRSQPCRIRPLELHIRLPARHQPAMEPRPRTKLRHSDAESPSQPAAAAAAERFTPEFESGLPAPGRERRGCASWRRGERTGGCSGDGAVECVSGRWCALIPHHDKTLS